MTAIEELVELRALYARAVNEFKCTPKEQLRVRRLRQLKLFSLAAALDATERITDYPHRQTSVLPDIDGLLEAL